MLARASHDAFSLTFPAELDGKDAAAWFYALGGLVTAGPLRFLHVRSVVLELEASPSGFTYRLITRHSDADFVTGQLRALIPGIRVTPTNLATASTWTRAVELGMRRMQHSLAASDPERISASLLASLSARSSTLLMQLVLSPAPRERVREPVRPMAGLKVGAVTIPKKARTDQDRLADRRAKLAEPNFLATLRLAVHAGSSAEADAALSAVRAALGSTRSTLNGFHARSVRQTVTMRRIDEAHTPYLFPIQLTAAEAVALSAWPIGSPHVAGLPQARSRQLPATAAIPSRGFVLCTSNFPGDERPLALSADDLCKHLHIVGPTGTGKTVLCSNLAVQMMHTGFGLVAIESKGDLFTSIIERIPKKRIDDVIIMDVSDSDFPVGFNVLSEGSPRAVVEELCALFEYLYRDTRSVWTRELLYYGLSTLVSRPDLTFVDLAPLLAPMRPSEEAWRNELVDSLTDPELKNFWERFRGQPRSAQDRMAQPVLDRVWQLNARPEIRNIIGQSKSAFHMNDVVATGKILLVNLSGLGQATASLAGTLLVSALWRAVQATPRNQPSYLLLDEFQDFIQLPIEPADMFAKARSRKLGIVAAHQELGQLPIELRHAVLANARSKVVFQTTADDARAITREFGRAVTDADFLNLGPYEVLCRLVTDGGVGAPVSGVTLPPARTRPWSNEVRTLSRERYSRAASAVEAEITNRRTPRSSPSSRRPKLGGQEWS